MRRLPTVLILTFLVLSLGCSRLAPKNKKNFDDIRNTVQGRTAAEIESLLGEPDSRQQMPLLGERWVWWNYTYLDGQSYPPEMRGRVVHLEIIFERRERTEGNAQAALSELRAADPLSVSYAIPQQSL